MSFQDPRSNKVAKLCEIKDLIGEWRMGENSFLKEDYKLLNSVLTEALDNPSEWSLNSDSRDIQLRNETNRETVLIDTQNKTYLWSQRDL